MVQAIQKHGFWVQLCDPGSGLPAYSSVGQCVYLITLYRFHILQCI